jgi:hypothetical protein
MGMADVLAPATPVFVAWPGSAPWLFTPGPSAAGCSFDPHANAAQSAPQNTADKAGPENFSIG